ncbi:3-hydroxybutyrate dehydrogenase [Evansella sp. AB-rgal1]|uniref:3-hydroxybutyrate dehydrogenase n=1 Tax=Evansella sp. AB-rgal1 TaxID=3242696 RepID=UPI00359F0512
MNEWVDKVVVVTGAASGIGKGIALKFVEQGATVIACDIYREQLSVMKHSVETEVANTSLYVSPFDITNESEVSETINSIISKHGKIDVLVNSAGLQYVSLLENYPSDMFEKLWRVMCFGPFLTMKNILPHMKQKKYGRILHLASINGLIGFAGKSAYNSAKHGLIGLTKVAALETALDGITVNALCPGYVDTPLVQNQLADLASTRNVSLEQVLDEVIYPLVPQKRLLSVEEIADYSIFLASEKASGITGQAVVMDGGYTVQ